MALKKWKICVGHCGPTSLWTKIIKAYTPDEAVRKYLEEKDGVVTQERYDALIDHVYEHIPEKRTAKDSD